MKKLIGGALFSVFVVAALVGFRDQIGRVWAAPDKVAGLEKTVEKQSKTQEDIEKLILEQQARIDKADATQQLNTAVAQATIESLKEQLALIADLKKKR